jgi:hypothetical protein
MAKGDRKVQKVIDTLGIEVVRELTGKSEATDDEVRQLVRKAISNWERHCGITVEIRSSDDVEERIESILDWLNCQPS